MKKHKPAVENISVNEAIFFSGSTIWARITVYWYKNNPSAYNTDFLTAVLQF